MNNIKHELQKRSAFTLVELMFVIAIIAVLSSIAVGVMRDAEDSARVASTKSRIAQIEAIMQLVMEDYEVRRLPMRNAVLLAYINANRMGGSTPIPLGVQLKNLRRRIMLDLIKAEFPTAYLDSGQFAPNPDLGNFPSRGMVAGAVGDQFVLSFKDWLDEDDPDYGYNVAVQLWAGGPNILLSDYLESRKTAEVSHWEQYATNTDLDQPGEYLYLELERINVDGSSALEMLGPSAVGDTDDDGLLEIVDAFGESMGLKILQAVPDTSDATKIVQDRWTFSETDWKRRNADGLPEGYQIANSVVPSVINSVRIQVFSQTLEERGEQ